MRKMFWIILILALISSSALIYLFFTGRLQTENIWGDNQVIQQGFNKPTAIELTPYYLNGQYTIILTGNESKWVEKVDVLDGKVIVTAKEEKDRTYRECDDKEICKDVIYYVPSSLPVKDSADSLSSKAELIKETDKGVNSFTYTLQGETYLKLGDNSIYIIADVSINAVLNNITAENNFTHLTLNDSSIVLYMPFDVDTSGTTYDYSPNNNDGTVTNAIFNSSGKFGGAFSFDGDGDYVDLGNDASLNFDGIKAFSISAWINTNSSGDLTFLSRYNGGVSSQYAFYASSGKLFLLREVNPWIITGNSPITTGNWVHVVGTYNGTHVSLYVNGVSDATPVAMGSILSSSTNVLIGASYTSGIVLSFFNGTIDDVIIFNRSLSSTEITALYNNQSQRYFNQGTAMYNTTVATGDNKINISSQINNIMGTNISLSIWDDVTDAWTEYQNITSLVNYTFTISDSATKINLSYLFLSDSYGFYTPEHIGNINLETWTSGGAGDSLYPIFSAYQDNNASLVDSGIGYFNVTVANSNGTVVLNINGTTILASNETETLFNASYSFASSGTYQYNWTAYGNGTSHNRNDSNSRYYQVNTSVADTTAPNLTIVQPIDRNYTRRIIGLNYTTSSDVVNCWYRNGTELVNYTLTCGTNATITYGADGFYTLWMFTNDSSRNLNSSSRNFEIDTTALSITIISPLTSVYYNNVTIDYNITTNGNGTCYYSLDGFKNNITLTRLNATYYNYTNSSLTNGKWNINYSCIDTWGNLNMSQSVIYNLTTITDITPPYFTIIPASATITYGNNFGVDFEATDETAFGNYTVNWTSSFYINGSGWLYNITPLSAGTYNLNVSINDTSGNRNFTIFNLTINQATGNITLKINHTTANFTSYNNTEIGYETWFNATLVNGTGEISIWLNGTSINTGTSPITNFTNLTLGIYNASAVYTGNTNYTSYIETWWINITMTEAPTIDSSNPIFSNFLLSPANNSEYNYGRNYWFNVSILSTNGTAGIEFNGTNYSLTNSSPSFYKTFLNFGRGDYEYYFWSFGNGSSHIYNHTELNYYKVKINTTLTLGLTATTPITYGTATNFAGSGCPAEIPSASCWINTTNQVYEASTITANYSMNSTNNYTTSSITKAVTINKATGECGDWIDNIRGDYTADNNTAQNIWLNATLETGTGPITLWLNTTPWNTGTSPIQNNTNLSIGTYYANCTYAGNTNYTSDMENWLITISEWTAPPSAGNVTATPSCKYKKFVYYNLRLPFFREMGCI